MSTKSLSQKILDQFESHKGDWISGGAIEKWVLENTKNTASNARRRLRELVEDGSLEQMETAKNGVNHAYYRDKREPRTKIEVKIIQTPDGPVAREYKVPV